MQVLDIQSNKTEDEEVVTIRFNLANNKPLPDGDALYYLINAIRKQNGKDHKSLDIMEKATVSNRIDACIARLKQIKEQMEF